MVRINRKLTPPLWPSKAVLCPSSPSQKLQYIVMGITFITFLVLALL